MYKHGKRPEAGLPSGRLEMKTPPVILLQLGYASKPQQGDFSTALEMTDWARQVSLA
jgi:hypothetical protein